MPQCNYSNACSVGGDTTTRGNQGLTHEVIYFFIFMVFTMFFDPNEPKGCGVNASPTDKQDMQSH